MCQCTAEELVAALTTLAATQNLHARAFEGYRKWLSDDTIAGPDGLSGWSAEEIEPHFRSSSLVFESSLLSYPFIVTRLDLCVRDDSAVFFRGWRPIGHYRLITQLDGTDDDDYFVIEESKSPGD